MKQRIMGLLPLFTILAGWWGGNLRRDQILTAFEADSGLPIPGHPATIRLLVFSIAVLFLLLLLSFLWRPRLPEGRAEVFQPLSPSLPDVVLWSVCQTVLCFAVLAAGALGLFQFLDGTDTRLSRLVFYLLALLTGVSLLSMVFGSRQGKRVAGLPGTGELPVLVPAFFSCLWLVLDYQNHAADPVLLGYMFELLAIICIALSFYGIAGASFGPPRPRRMLFFSMLAVYFTCLTFADLWLPQSLLSLLPKLPPTLETVAPLPMRLLYAACALYVGLMSGVLLHNDAILCANPSKIRRGRRPDAEYTNAEDPDAEYTNAEDPDAEDPDAEREKRGDDPGTP